MAPQRRPSTNRRANLATPEVWFRIVHVTLDESNGSAAYREQKVEVTLGPDWAFENGNIGVLTRQVPTDRVVSAVPPPRYPPRPPEPPREPRTPPVVETLRKALAWRQELDSGAVATQADIARREGVTRARVTQIMMLLRLAPVIQERVLALTATDDRPILTERVLRPVTCMPDLDRQLIAFTRLGSHVTRPSRSNQSFKDIRTHFSGLHGTDRG